MAKTLQQQGVPVPSRLRGPGVPSSQGRSVQSGNSSTSPARNATRNRRSTRRTRDYNPASVGNDVAGSTSSGSGVGTLEAEFLVGLALLIMLMFASGQSYSDKIMSVMKRGALLCVMFFILALVAASGPNAAKIAKAFGALAIVAILVTSPVNTVITDLDHLIKNDWVGSSETGGTGSGNTGSASANTGTQGSTNNNTGLGSSQIGQQITGLPVGSAATPLPGSPEVKAISSAVESALKKIGLWP